MARRKTAHKFGTRQPYNGEIWQSYNGEISPKKPLRNYTISCTVSFPVTFITDQATQTKAKADAISGLKTAYAHRLNMS